MAPLSSRKTFKALGIVLVILGVVTVLYGVLVVKPYSFHLQAGPDPALGEVFGETRYQQLIVAFVGCVMIFLGYRSYKFIPYAEREKEEVTELDLEKEK